MADRLSDSTNEHLFAVFLEDAARVARGRAHELAMAALILLNDSDRNPEEASARAKRIACVRDELRGAVDTYTRTMQAMGEPPERVIVAVKTMVDSAVSDLFLEGKPRPQLWDADLRGDVVQWTIAAYYDDTGRSD
jgi:hypothetical protein